ncbi:hypothetical protein [Notoacmeibacter ruber]|uniref:Nitroreductase domain-containing protein n=1 Tax=Notoacmeibacter ruber TaxID=2670375 RepID=A0A3L7J3H9_9HYPH|nr:hypothetical protein [Notoacmeibacter ruber]RLQ85196.1 hypothetical protein D8780_14625 [Notoacmeibacter ruber]
MTDPIAAIRNAAATARWAPSSHNSQPWQVEIEPLNSMEMRHVHIRLDETARLRALDALDDEMAISLGLFAGTFCRELGSAGVPYRVSADPPTALTIRVGPAPSRKPEKVQERTDEIRARRTSRGAFSPRLLTVSDRKALQTRQWTGLGIGTAASVQLLEDAVLRQSVAGLLERYGAQDFSHFAAWSETYAHIKFVPASALHEGRGFSIESILGPLSPMRRSLMRIVLHPVTMQFLRPFGLPRAMARSLAELAFGSPALVVLVAEDTRPEFFDLVETGNRLAEIWLTAERQGLCLHPLSVLLQHPDARQALRQALGLSGQPVFIARVGEALQPAPPSPRIPTDALVTYRPPAATAAS